MPIGVQSLGAFLSFYLILNSFIPLEVPVMVELSKFMATYFIEQDAYMMKPNKYNKGEIDQLKVQTMNLHEELGEISFIFCDKTGTLTKNELVFSHLSVQNQGVVDLNYTKMFDTILMSIDDMRRELLEHNMMDQHVEHLFKCMSLCQDCLIIPFGDKKKDFSYQGPSLDEVCLLDFVYDLGTFGHFIKRDSDTIYLKVE